MPQKSPHAPNINDVERFWENHPLFQFESPYTTGSAAFFEWHDHVRVYDVDYFALPMYEFDQHVGEAVLDVGCGIGWLCQNYAAGGAKIVGIDLTKRGIHLTRQRLGYKDLEAQLVQANAEYLPWENESFDFVVSAGVLHHTPDTEACIQEIYRVLRRGGRGMISLYHKSWLLNDTLWPLTRFFIHHLFGQVAGRSQFKAVQTQADLVRLYDGNDNPLGKAYSKQEMRHLLRNFVIEKLEIHYFPLRFLPIQVPRQLSRFLDRFFGLMVYATIRKDSS